ncbi:pyridoxal phosphate-dependent decarboxylase family protein [Streptomyces clavuligerus]|nr:aminotransferase class I/II-fold pyridoxal phosphate-dependent enzyme [Streptomyces clavuligerus]
MGLITTGASMAALSAVTAARERHLGDDLRSGTAYVAEHTHPAMVKAARVAGVLPDRVRRVPVTGDLHMDVDAVREAVGRDRARGLRPFLLVGTAGTTDTGAVDPLRPLADLARRNGMWFHIDAAYGGFFILTERGRARLRGVERADSIGLDPHKSLFLPFGTGILLVRDAGTLRAPFACDADCLLDVRDGGGLTDYADYGPELTREFRGLRLWLPLHLHGLGAFRDALDEKLTLAAYAYGRLSTEPLVGTVYPPELSTVAFHIRGLDDTGHTRLLRGVNEQGRIQLSSTRVLGRVALRLCVMSHRTHREHVEEALDIILDAAGPGARTPLSQATGSLSRSTGPGTGKTAHPERPTVQPPAQGAI